MRKAKKLLMSFTVLVLSALMVFSLTSCKEEEYVVTLDDITLAQSEYQQYVNSKEYVAPNAVIAPIDGANYSSVTQDPVTGQKTSVTEIDVTENGLNPGNGTRNLTLLIECFIDIDEKGYTAQELQYIYEGIFGTSTVTISDAARKAALDNLVIQSKNLIENRKSNGKVLIHESNGEITWEVNVPEAGFYNLYLNYFTVTGYSSAIERTLKINGVVPFDGADSFTFSRVWKDSDSSFDEQGNFKVDSNGNDLKPQQVEVYTFRETYLKDDMGYTTEPYKFYFEKGVNTITFASIKEPIIIDQIEVKAIKEAVSYSEYLTALETEFGTTRITNQTTGKIQAEKALYKSSPTLYPTTDRSSSNTTPHSLKVTKKNAIGGDQWKVLGDWISWEFSVPADGFYNISMRARQNLVRGMYSSRIAYVNEKGAANDTPFAELSDVQFQFSSDWQNVTLGNADGAYEFYFEAGKTYVFTLEVTLGQYAPLVEQIQATIDDLSKIYRTIVSYTTTSPDKNRDYELTTKFPELFDKEDGTYGLLHESLDQLAAISNEIAVISGTESDKTGVINSMVRQLQEFIEKPRMITQKLSSFSNNISSLGTLLTSLRELPLAIDYIEVHTSDVKLEKPNEGILRKTWNGICSFFLSFFIDYSTIGETEESANTTTSEEIEVWMTLGRDQANVVRSLIDTTFTKQTGIKVNLKLTGADVLLKATLAGIGPDVALNVDSTLPVNYALRNAVYDLTQFDDFWDTVYLMPEGAMTWDNSYENVYHASSLRQFSFYSITNEDIAKAEAGDKAAKAKVEAYYAVEDYCAAKGIKKEDLFDSETYLNKSNPDYQFVKENIHGIYALPEKQIFMVMFVRDDIFEENGWTDMIPTTWDGVIDLVAELQTQQLQFYLPVNDAGAMALNPVYVSMLFQNGGSLYVNDNKETGLLSDASMRSFEFWTEFYTLYSFPKAASFINRFRSGEMPIGIAYYEAYNTLSVFAPELKGKWSFYLIPGTVQEDGTIDNTSTASGTGAVIMKQPDKLSKAEQQAKYNASWEFLKWWSGAESQAQFGREMEGILGSAARHATANVKAFQSLAWPQSDLEKLMLQWSKVHEMPQVAGSYIIGREIENAYREVINNNFNAREVLVEYCGNINDEINRKRKEFDLPTLDDK